VAGFVDVEEADVVTDVVVTDVVVTASHSANGVVDPEGLVVVVVAGVVVVVAGLVVVAGVVVEDLTASHPLDEPSDESPRFFS
jgi:hypothetical protein